MKFETLYFLAPATLHKNTLPHIYLSGYLLFTTAHSVVHLSFFAIL